MDATIKDLGLRVLGFRAVSVGNLGWMIRAAFFEARPNTLPLQFGPLGDFCP